MTVSEIDPKLTSRTVAIDRILRPNPPQKTRLTLRKGPSDRTPKKVDRLRTLEGLLGHPSSD